MKKKVFEKYVNAQIFWQSSFSVKYKYFKDGAFI